MNQKCIDFWFDYASPYSYLSALRIEALAEKAGVKVNWNPFVLGALFKHLGWANAPGLVFPQKAAYMWLDVGRQCAKHGLPWVGKAPTHFPANPILAERITCVALKEGWHSPWIKGVFQLHFAQDQNIADQAILSPLLESLGQDPARVYAQATSPEIKQELIERTNQAIASGMIGAPTFFVQQEIYWGDDRLEDALVRLTQS